MKTILLTYAVKEEFVPIYIEGYNVVSILTGIGKTRSTFFLTQKIMTENPILVLNMGTAGTVSHNIGDVLVATHFIDRDYEAIKLPGINYEIAGDEVIGGNKVLRDWVSTYPKTGVCSTGDTFVTEISSVSGDFVDMEAYSQAYVCRELGIPFLSIKYITDIIGQNSVEHWESKLADARKGLAAWIKEYHIAQIISEMNLS